MKVIADKDIPFLKGVLEPYAQVVYLPGAEISREDCVSADALLVRTRTRCDSSLLEGSRVSFVGTATIGTDHLDTRWLHSAGIAYANAPGCNACGVMQYVHTALFTLAAMKDLNLSGMTLGVVGDGNTGERTALLAELLGFRVLRNDIDPALAARTVPLKDLLRQSDIVSCHLPLDGTTRGMVSEEFLSCMKDGAILVNTCRGEVLCDDALLQHRNRLAGVILDVWNGEPSLLRHDVLAAADIATPHIAGYSHEGKLKGTAMAVRALARHFGIVPLRDYRPQAEPLPQLHFPHVPMSVQQQRQLAADMQKIFPIMELDAALRRAPEDFEKLRKGYSYRHEFAVPEYIA